MLSVNVNYFFWKKFSVRYCGMGVEIAFEALLHSRVD